MDENGACVETTVLCTTFAPQVLLDADAAVEPPNCDANSAVLFTKTKLLRTRRAVVVDVADAVGQGLSP